MKRIKGKMLIVTTILYLAVSAHAYESWYLVQSEFGDSLSCDLMARGIFLVWWDNKNDLSTEAAILLDSMTVYRDICLDTLTMQDPPNPQDGYYYNIYLHETGDVFPEGWGCGCGTDCFGYPYMTLPIASLDNWITISHETFHVFQYSGDAPGFDHPDAQWYVEASANWFAAITHPDDPDAFVEAESLVRIPHVAMWLGYANFPEYYPENWQRYVHQYAMALFLFYLTEEEGVPFSQICGGFYNAENLQTLLPQEYLYAGLGAVEMRNHFIDWAAHMTNDFDFILPSQKEMALEHWNTYADPFDDNEFTRAFFNTGTGGWYRPANSLTTTAWSFNTYKILNISNDFYSFHLNGDTFGSEADSARFQGKILVMNTLTGTRFYDLIMLNETQGSLTVDVTTADTELYFIVTSMPDMFTDAEQIFGYDICIEKGATSVYNTLEHPEAVHLDLISPNPFKSTTMLEFQIPTAGPVRLTVYDLNGHLVTTVLEEDLLAGCHDTVWDGRDSAGRDLPGGVYLFRLEASGQVAHGITTLLR